MRIHTTNYFDRLARVGIVGLFCFAGTAWSQISLLHATNCGPGGFPGTTCTLPATGSGNLIVIGWEMVQPASGVSITSITDNVGNVYTEAGASKASYVSATVDIWYAKNSTAGATSITITTSGSVSTAAAVVWEFSGADTSAPVDAVGVLNNQPATATPVSPTVITTQANDVVVALVDVDNQIAGITNGNSFISDSLLMNNGFAHILAPVAGSYSAKWNESPSGAYASSAVAFKAAGTTIVVNGTALNACDLAAPFGVVNAADVTAAVNMALGTSPCTADVEGPNTCTVATVQRVINASQGQACVVFNTVVAPSISSSTAASGTVGTPFSYQIAATNSPVSYGTGGLPGGLSINTTSGLISGTPTTAGTTSVSLSATNAGGTGTASLALTINAAPVISHSVTLTWTASTSANIAGYNIYRAASSAGTYTKLNSAAVSGVTYVDSAVTAGQTYFYAATAVDSSGNESVKSSQTSAVIPTT